MKISLPSRLVNYIDQSLKWNGQPFDAESAMHLPQDHWIVAHYGIMIPNLPDPYRFLDVISVIGQPNVKIFSNPQLIKTTALDTATVLVGTGTEQDNFTAYSVQQQCSLHSQNKQLALQFGNDLSITGSYPHFSATRTDHSFNFNLQLKASDKVSHFAKVKFDLYDHWSILCEYQGQITSNNQTIDVSGLCTFEYARAAKMNLPFTFFSYQILNIDDKTQVLMVEVLGKFNTIVQQRVYVRALDDYGQVYSKNFVFEVTEYLQDKAITPQGFAMKLPKKFTWSVDDEHGRELIYVEGETNNDFCYGMAAGYAGSYAYQGRFKGKAIQGKGGYIENIDYR